MKKIFTLVCAATAAMTLWAQDPSVVLDLSAPTNPTTIEINETGYWTGTYDENYSAIEFAPFKLSHLIGGSSWGGMYWDGFTVCKGNDMDNHNNDGWPGTYEWFNMAGGGVGSIDPTGSVVADPNQPYVIAYWASFMGNDCNVVTMTEGQSFQVDGMYVTNTTQGYYVAKEGNAMARALDQEGDAFVLEAHGVDATGAETVSRFKLAGYDNGEFYGVTDWQWWDLSGLGEIVKLYFTMTSTDTGTYGINTPTYFALDRLTVSNLGSSAVKAVEADRQVAAVNYVNMAGQRSSRPFDGMNIVVTRYTDGTTSTAKVIK